ncbi:MAG: hypothetical protein IBJ17_07820 [Reyranella sp.]|nr:hypothetical protein [Reyranella sp.]
MTRLRSLLWLLALGALVFPSFGIAVVPSHASSAHAVPPAMQMTSLECEHAPPPPDCPDRGTARHAAGTCCPLMSASVAVLLPEMGMEGPPAAFVRVLAGAARLAGLSSVQDPPPPRS